MPTRGTGKRLYLKRPLPVAARSATMHPSQAANTFPLSGLWRHRDLLWQFAQRNIEVRHKGSFLGFMWAFANPLLMLGMYVVVFGYIFGGSFDVLPNETRIDYALGVFLGLTVFHFLAEIISLSPSLIISNPNLVKKVVFPLEVLPAATVASAGFHMLISLGLVLVGVVVFGNGLAVGALWLPLILLPMVLLCTGTAMGICALGVFWRDITQLTQFVSLGIMYASAIFFPASQIPPSIWAVLRFNPLLLAVELARDALLWDRTINWHHLAYLWVAGAVALWIGAGIFRRLRPAFADVI